MTKGVSVNLDFSASWFFSIQNYQEIPGVGLQIYANAKIEEFGRRPSGSYKLGAGLYLLKIFIRTAG